jgi:hypothetical protein
VVVRHHVVIVAAVKLCMCFPLEVKGRVIRGVGKVTGKETLNVQALRNYFPALM